MNLITEMRGHAMKQPLPVARVISYGLGLIFYACGACLATKTALGLTPVTSISYVLSLASQLSLGTVMLLYNIFMLLAERVVFGKDFPKKAYLQLPLSIVFSSIVDGFVFLFRNLSLDDLAARATVFAIALVFMALGITGTLCGDFIPLPAEGVVQSCVLPLKKDFCKTKLVHDCILVLATVIFSRTLLRHIEGIQVGTLVSALTLGPMSRVGIGIVQPLVKRLSPKAELAM